ncbi:unnamed protein product [Allacma fusca]|uniref:Uncharacterized protein n=1 Tax=Allacma fusca TaxID=39272 RepID=A0A8J2P339_9HEXA|nr:unnamed protein product [Allacma fusca]
MEDSQSSSEAASSLNQVVTKDGCVLALTGIFMENRGVPLKNVIERQILYFVNSTTSPFYLGLCLLQNNLMVDNERQQINSKSTLYEQNEFIYSVLSRKVRYKNQYVDLVKALFDSGNSHIAQEILTVLRENSTRGLHNSRRISTTWNRFSSPKILLCAPNILEVCLLRDSCDSRYIFFHPDDRSSYQQFGESGSG